MEKTQGIKHFFHAFKYSMQGFKSAIKYESAFRQELIVACIAIPLACYFAQNKYDFILLILPIFLLLALELINSAIESVVDRMGLEFNELAGRAKDYGSASISVVLILTIIIWVDIILF